MHSAITRSARAITDHKCRGTAESAENLFECCVYVELCVCAVKAFTNLQTLTRVRPKLDLEPKAKRYQINEP